MFSKIAAFAASIKVAADISKALITTADEVKRQGVVLDSNTALLEIQAKAMALQSRNRTRRGATGR